MSEAEARKFPKKFFVNEQKTFIENHNLQEKTRRMIAHIQVPGISSGGERAVFFLSEPRISGDRKYVEEHVLKKGEYSKPEIIGIAQRKLSTMQPSVMDMKHPFLLKEYFLKHKPRLVFLKENYKD